MPKAKAFEGPVYVMRPRGNTDGQNVVFAGPDPVGSFYSWDRAEDFAARLRVTIAHGALPVPVEPTERDLRVEGMVQRYDRHSRWQLACELQRSQTEIRRLRATIAAAEKGKVKR